LPATLAPARFTTATAPSTLQGPVPSLGSATGSSPLALSAFERCVPINPLAPATTTRMPDRCADDLVDSHLRYPPRP
jgi:hypothetical protein